MVPRRFTKEYLPQIVFSNVNVPGRQADSQCYQDQHLQNLFKQSIFKNILEDNRTKNF